MGTAGVTPNTPAASPVSEKSTPSADSPDTADRIVREEAATEARRVEEGVCNFIFQEARRFLVKQFDEEYVKQNLGKLMHPQLQSHYGMLGPLVFLPDEVGNKFAKSFRCRHCEGAKMYPDPEGVKAAIDSAHVPGLTGVIANLIAEFAHALRCKPCGGTGFVYPEPWMTGSIQREALRLQNGGISVAK